MNDRQSKKDQFETGDRKGRPSFGRKSLFTLVVLAAGALVAFVALEKASGGSPLVKAEQGRVSIPVAEVDDGQAHFFTFEHAGTRVDFFLLKSADGVVRAAFDTCDVCFREK